MRLVLIALLLFGYWLALSGHYEWWLVAFGAVLSVLVVLFCFAKNVTDAEGFPIGLFPRGLIYWPWLLWQIVLSGLRVTRLILSPSLPISPTLVKVDAQQETAVGLVTYANSITLTPGTISVEVEEGEFLVHAVNFCDEDLDALAEMDRRVSTTVMVPS